MGKPSTVEEYIDSFDEPVRARLEELRTLSRQCAPAASEALKWGHPAYSLSTILFVFSAHRHHVNVTFTPSTLQAFIDRLEGFATGKGSVKVPYDVPLPSEVLAEMIEYRVQESEVHGVGWM